MAGSGTNKFIFNEKLNSSFLEELFDGDTHYAETVFEEFLHDLPACWRAVEQAYIEKNIPALSTAVHKCKTLFGYVGVTPLQELCQDIENKCHQLSTIAALKPDYELLSAGKEATIELIKGEINRLKSFNHRN